MRNDSGYTVIRHPVTDRFVCKIDFERDIMYVVDRGKEAIIDLAQVRSANNGQQSVISGRYRDETSVHVS